MLLTFSNQYFELDFKARHGTTVVLTSITASLLFGMFMGLISYVSAGRLNEWYETGHLLMHKRMPIGPDAITSSSDPILFLLEFGLNIFLIAMGGLGVLAMCREIIVEMVGPQSGLLRLLDWHYANQTASIVVGLAGWFLLVVFTFGLLYRLLDGFRVRDDEAKLS